MSPYNIINRVLVVEYAMTVIFAAFDKKPIVCTYWIGAVILQLGIIMGLK
jgi:hypothetical protein